MRSVEIHSDIPLKTCPFCGERAALYREEIEFPLHGWYKYHVRCTNDLCMVQPRTVCAHENYKPRTETIKLAISWWNGREMTLR